MDLLWFKNVCIIFVWHLIFNKLFCYPGGQQFNGGKKPDSLRSDVLIDKLLPVFSGFYSLFLVPALWCDIVRHWYTQQQSCYIISVRELGIINRYQFLLLTCAHCSFFIICIFCNCSFVQQSKTWQHVFFCHGLVNCPEQNS